MNEGCKNYNCQCAYCISLRERMEAALERKPNQQYRVETNCFGDKVYYDETGEAVGVITRYQC